MVTGGILTCEQKHSTIAEVLQGDEYQETHPNVNQRLRVGETVVRADEGIQRLHNRSCLETKLPLSPCFGSKP